MYRFRQVHQITLEIVWVNYMVRLHACKSASLIGREELPRPDQFSFATSRPDLTGTVFDTGGG